MRTFLHILIMTFGLSIQAQANVIVLNQRFVGALFKVDKISVNNGFDYKYTPLNKTCGVELGRLQFIEDGERFKVEYRLAGLPSEVDKDFTAGVAEGNAQDSIYGAQNLVNAGLFGNSEVVTDFWFVETDINKFKSKQKLAMIKFNIAYTSSMSDYFGGNGDKWHFECRINN